MISAAVDKSKIHDQVQYAALPFRYGVDGRLRFLLLTSRDTRRWVIPKGWPMHERKGREVAAQEAFEEAGLLGSIVGKHPIGSYHYEKRLTAHHGVLCEVKVFLFHVERRLDDWPEKAEREARWFLPAEAYDLVDEGGLAEILRLASKSAATEPFRVER